MVLRKEESFKSRTYLRLFGDLFFFFLFVFLDGLGEEFLLILVVNDESFVTEMKKRD